MKKKIEKIDIKIVGNPTYLNPRDYFIDMIALKVNEIIDVLNSSKKKL
ncbi:MAG: hypothetical protein AABY22_17210 [Nanoarchaeota archaeon]